MKLQSRQSEHQTSNAKKDSHRICLSGGEGNGGFNGTGKGEGEKKKRGRGSSAERERSRPRNAAAPIPELGQWEHSAGRLLQESMGFRGIALLYPCGCSIHRMFYAQWPCAVLHTP